MDMGHTLSEQFVKSTPKTSFTFIHGEQDEEINVKVKILIGNLSAHLTLWKQRGCKRKRIKMSVRMESSNNGFEFVSKQERKYFG